MQTGSSTIPVPSELMFLSLVSYHKHCILRYLKPSFCLLKERSDLQMNSNMPSMLSLPPEILVYHILLDLCAQDVLSLGSTNKYFRDYCNDELLWQRKCEEDFHKFKGSFTNRASGWKALYKGFTNPKVYVWGYALT